MIFGYARVSTAKQSTDGTSLESQEEALKGAGAEEIYKDAYTGTTTARPEFQKLHEVIKEGDTLVVTKLDRLARSAQQGLEIIEELQKKGVAINVLNMGKFDDSPNGKLMRTILLGFAEFERDMIMERTREGRERARLKEGFRDGRPRKFSEAQERHAMELLDGGCSYTEVSRMTGISRSTLVRMRSEYKAKEREEKANEE